MTTYTLPAGQYVVCDPCYCFTHETGTWHKIIKAQSLVGDMAQFTYNEHQLLYFMAEGATGDDGYDYPIDSVTFGLTPLVLVESDRSWLFQEKNFSVPSARGRRQVRERGALLIESSQRIQVTLEGRYLTVLGHRFELGLLK